MKVADALAGVQRLFLDTAPVIYHVEQNPAYLHVIDAVFAAIVQGMPQAVTSSVTLAESLVLPFRNGDLALAQSLRAAITSGQNTVYVGVDAVAEQAAEFRARYNLSLLDAFQVAAAIVAACDAFLTNDAGLKRVQEIQVLIVDELEA